jgi:hypothetical protein
MVMEHKLTERQWMLELNRIGTEQGMYGFPLPPEVLGAGNCWLEDYEAGLTPRQAIEADRIHSSTRKTLESS